MISVIQHENESWNPRSIYHNKNGSIDYGVMQFNCPTHRASEPFRRRFCRHPKRLLRFDVAVMAGARELRSKRESCERKHDIDKTSLARRPYRLYELQPLAALLTTSTTKPVEQVLSCVACRLLPLYAIIGRFLKSHYIRNSIKNELMSHWWVQHYNWRSRGYAKRVLYVYMSLLLRVKATYPLIRRHEYPILYRMGIIDECLQVDDMCVRRIERWRKKTKRSR